MLFRSDQPPNYIPTGGDCDDEDPDISPGAEEVCDEVDNDCDLDIDEDVTTTWYADADEDGYGDAAYPAVGCEQPVGTVENDYDCDDDSAEVNPSATDVCDEIDNDCDTDIDEDPDIVRYRDEDEDGYGDEDVTVLSCETPTGYVDIGGDCDDTDDTLNPDTPWYADTDSDGFGDPDVETAICEGPSGYVGDSTDCDDGDGTAYPGATEVCDGDLEDCDGSSDEGVLSTFYKDKDKDGYGDAAKSVEDCSAPTGYVDDDTDCDDTDSGVHPGASETCNGVDDDCDFSTDEGVTTTYYIDSDSDGYGTSSTTTEDCSTPSGYSDNDDDCDDSDSGVNPGATETCNDGIDQDCDGGPGSCGINGELDMGAGDYQARWIGDGNDEAGQGIAIGDIDDDGNDDLVVGAYYHYITSYDGWVHGVYGPISTGGTLSSVADVTWAGDSGKQEGVGYAVEFGDFDGDGVDDLAVGGHTAAYVLYGPATTPFTLNSTYADVRFADGSTNSFFGDSVEVGDVDGDGNDDLLISAYEQTTSYYQEGAAFLYLGSSLASYEAFYEGASYGDDFGRDIDIAPDTDGDGYDELIFGAPENDTYGAAYGAAYMVLGATAFSDLTMSNSSLVTDAWFRTSSAYATSRLGYGVGGVGDIDGDGYGDVAMGAYWAGGTGGTGTDPYGGRVAIFLGPVTGSHLWHNGDIIVTGAYGQRLASFIDGDDVDGDGNTDLLVASDQASDFSTYAGGAWVFFGPLSSGSSIPTTDADVSVVPGATYDYLGNDMVVGDLNADGYPDLFVGASGDDVSSSTSREGAVYMLMGGSY